MVSVVIKWFRKGEELRTQALKLRQAYLDGHLMIHVPDLLLYEIANVLRDKRDMDSNKVQQAVKSLFDMKVIVEQVTSRTIGRAIQIAHAHNVTVYDAAFVALADRLGVDFITADETLVRKLASVSYIHYLGGSPVSERQNTDSSDDMDWR